MLKNRCITTSQLITCFLTFILAITTHVANANANEFSECKTNLKHLAQTQGFSSYIVDDIIDGLSPINRVITLDNNQAEFVESFAQYVNKRVSSYHVKHGKALLKKHQTLFENLHQQYGIPPQYLVSFWGLETVFGKHKGKMSVLNSIATLACDQRRSEYFTSELFDLFYLLDNNTVEVSQLQGSWAGAMGHMQFMPSAFRQYAVDGDNDGKIDVWQSEVDAITTAANYLNKIGWQKRERWGREVLLPENFDFSAVEFDQTYSLSTFAEMGVTKITGKALPHYQTQAELVLPNGAQGHAFLVYQNFNVIMDWNLSKSYALSVGILADKLIGASGVRALKNTQPLAFSRTQMEKLQVKLNALGFDSGKPDGLWGPNSRKAIRKYQLEKDLVADGFPNQEVFELLGLQQS